MNVGVPEIVERIRSLGSGHIDIKYRGGEGHLGLRVIQDERSGAERERARSPVLVVSGVWIVS
jgi:hypothetical protein